MHLFTLLSLAKRRSEFYLSTERFSKRYDTLLKSTWEENTLKVIQGQHASYLFIFELGVLEKVASFLKKVNNKTNRVFKFFCFFFVLLR